MWVTRRSRYIKQILKKKQRASCSTSEAVYGVSFTPLKFPISVPILLPISVIGTTAGIRNEGDKTTMIEL
jgi:hypothetical protein